MRTVLSFVFVLVGFSVAFCQDGNVLQIQFEEAKISVSDAALKKLEAEGKLLDATATADRLRDAAKTAATAAEEQRRIAEAFSGKADSLRKEKELLEKQKAFLVLRQSYLPLYLEWQETDRKVKEAEEELAKSGTPTAQAALVAAKAERTAAVNKCDNMPNIVAYRAARKAAAPVDDFLKIDNLIDLKKRIDEMQNRISEISSELDLLEEEAKDELRKALRLGTASELATTTANAAEEAKKIAETAASNAAESLHAAEKDFAEKAALVLAASTPADIASMRGELAALRSKLTEEIGLRASETDLTAAIKRIETLEKELGEVKAKQVSQQEEFAKYNETLEDNSMKLDDHEKRLAAAEQAIKELRDSIKDLQDNCLRMTLTEEQAKALAAQLGLAEMQSRIAREVEGREQEILKGVKQKLQTLEEKFGKLPKPRKDAFVVKKEIRQYRDRYGRNCSCSRMVYVPLEKAFVE